MSDVLAAAAVGSRFEPPAAGALGGFSGAELSSGTGRAAGPEDGGGRGGGVGTQRGLPCGVGGWRGTRGSSFGRCLCALLSACSQGQKVTSLPAFCLSLENEAAAQRTEPAEQRGDGSERTQPPPLAPPTTWTTGKMKEFKAKMGKEKSARMVVKRGEVVTVRVPTHPDGKRVCWEFATDDYDIGFGVYFDWTTVTSTAITVQVSESSDEEDEEEEEEIEGLAPVGDVERGSKSYLRNRYGEIMPVYRRDSHREVQAGSHDYPGEGVYLLKFDNSYSLLRNKTLFFHVFYTS
uniref:Transmembrane p24 trafficking protein family member 8 n=1 Tax=Pavo cristatus TaxID=9049 RepID=A0A8C9FCB9_PAVCR